MAKVAFNSELRQAAADLCRAFGLDPNNVRSVAFKFGGEDPVGVTFECFNDQATALSLAALLDTIRPVSGDVTVIGPQEAADAQA